MLQINVFCVRLRKMKVAETFAFTFHLNSIFLASLRLVDVLHRPINFKKNKTTRFAQRFRDYSFVKVYRNITALIIRACTCIVHVHTLGDYILNINLEFSIILLIWKIYSIRKYEFSYFADFQQENRNGANVYHFRIILVSNARVQYDSNTNNSLRKKKKKTFVERQRIFTFLISRDTVCALAERSDVFYITCTFALIYIARAKHCQRCNLQPHRVKAQATQVRAV